jgi:hypothetical protein
VIAHEAAMKQSKLDRLVTWLLLFGFPSSSVTLKLQPSLSKLWSSTFGGEALRFAMLQRVMSSRAANSQFVALVVLAG